MSTMICNISVRINFMLCKIFNEINSIHLCNTHKWSLYYITLILKATLQMRLFLSLLEPTFFKVLIQIPSDSVIKLVSFIKGFCKGEGVFPGIQPKQTQDSFCSARPPLRCLRLGKRPRRFQTFHLQHQLVMAVPGHWQVLQEPNKWILKYFLLLTQNSLSYFHFSFLHSLFSNLSWKFIFSFSY